MRLKMMWDIALADLRVYFANSGNLVGIFVTPVIFVIMLGFVFSSSGSEATQVRVDVVNNDAGELGSQLIADLRTANSSLYFCPMDDGAEVNGKTVSCNFDDGQTTLSVEDVQTRVEERATSAAIVIPADYTANIRALEDVSLTYYSLADITSGDPVRQTLDAVRAQIDGSVIAARIGLNVGLLVAGDSLGDEATQTAFSEAVYTNANEQLANPAVTVQYVSTEGGLQPSNAPTGFSQSVPGMATMFVMFTVLGGMQIMLRERQNWTLQRLVMMPISRAEILGGKIIARFVTGMVQFLLIFALGTLPFVNLDFGNNPVALFAVMIAYTLAVTALAFALSPFFATEEQVGFATTLVVLPLAALGGAWWPLEIVPDIMDKIGHLSPVAWAMDGFNQLIFYNGGWGDIVVPIIVLLGFTVVLFGFGIVNFRTE